MRSLTKMRVLALAGLSLLVGLSAEAQFTQYTPPGGAGLENEDVRERMEQALAEARWNLGPIRLDPWIGITDAGLQEDAQDSGGSESEATATVGVGLRAYLPTGRKVMWAAHALPEYAWRDGDSERSRLNGRYGVGMFAFWNRLGVEATARREDVQSFFSSEVLERTNFRSDRLNVHTELDLARTLAVFAEGLLLQTRFLDQEPAQPTDPDGGPLRPFGVLDRDESVVRAGVRRKVAHGLTLGLGIEHSEVEFDLSPAELLIDPTLARDNSGTAPVLEISYPANRVEAQADLALRSLDGGPGFVPYDGVTGQAQVAFDLGWRIRLTLFGTRNLIYALERGYSYFEEDRVGLSLGTRLHRRLFLTLFHENGDADFARLTPDVPVRLDELTRSGAELALSLPADTRFIVSLVDLETDSNLPGEDQSFTFLSFGLRISTGQSPWW